MRLYLSSQNVGDHADRLIKMVGDNLTVAYISNAKDDSEEELRIKIPKHKTEFEAKGFTFKEFDLLKYIGNAKKLEKEISKFGLVWGTGGNTFLLRRAMYDSGLDKILIKLLKQDCFVYGGSSAGSIVTTPSLKGCDQWDNVNAVKELYGKEPVWDGLDLVPFYFVPHYKSDWAEQEAQELADFYSRQGFDHVLAKDGQVYVVDGDKQELLV